MRHLQDASTSRGTATRQWARETIQRLKGLADRKRPHRDDTWLTSETCRTMAELTPSLVADQERIGHGSEPEHAEMVEAERKVAQELYP